MLNPTATGLVFLIGQVMDGIATIVVGVISDRINTRIGKRQPWYILGSLMTIPGFICFFSYPSFVMKQSQEFIRNFFIVTFCVFNVGWACVQISNMSIVNQLTYSNRRRDLLANNRNAFTYGAFVYTLVMSIIIFSIVKDSVNQFRVLCLAGTVLGTITTFYYVIMIREPSLSEQARILEDEY